MNLFVKWKSQAFAFGKRYDFFIFYALSIALGRGLSIFVLPITSRFIPPGDYARLDVAASVIEICGLFASFAMTDLVFRFAAPAKTDAEQRRVASGILGVGLTCAAITFVVTQLVLPLFAAGLSLGVSEGALRAGLAAAACVGLIELPLAWLRMRNRPGLYLLFIAGRSIAQISLMIGVLAAGHGPEGVIVSNACLELFLTLILVYKQLRSFGVSLPKEMARHALDYSMPIVIGSLAMFGLGTCDRFFLAGAVPAATLAHYTLAGKLAFATPLLLQPFLLWWGPQRIALLSEHGGLERSRRMVGLGLMILAASSLFVMLVGALFLQYAMPASYHGAVQLLPLLVFVCVLNEIASLVNVGAFAKTHGREVLLVNGLGGLAAFVGYLVLVPWAGVYGAIVATILGHGLRIALFITFGRGTAPIPYPVTAIMGLAVSMAMLVYIRPSLDDLVLQGVFSLFAFAVILAVARVFGLVTDFRSLFGVSPPDRLQSQPLVSKALS